MKGLQWPKWLCTMVLAWGVVAGAQASSPAADDVQARELALAAQLRCVVCQNQTVAESQAPMAADMRREIRTQMELGHSDAEVVAFFEQRYGAFVRYNPPWKASTWLLWGGPFVVAVWGLWLLRRTLRRRTPTAEALTTSQRQRVQAWLDQADEEKHP